MKRQLVAEQWDQFARLVLPKEAPADQRREMRRAFYSGAQAILFNVIASLDEEPEPTGEDLRIIDGVGRELEDFAEMVKNGRA